jgi:alkylation response protein AidB-like acyl-CoA dehydrogenase
MMRSLSTPDPSAAPAADPTADELVARAAALRPRLIELQERHEEEGGYSEEIHQALLDGGFYRVLHPRKYGGLELSLVDFMRIGIEISRGDPGVGWAYILGAGHAFHVASFYGEEGQAELFADTLVAPGRTIPHGKAVAVPGGYRLSGTWDYCSGSRWSTHVLVVAPTDAGTGEPPALTMFAVPRSDYEILDDWGGDQTIGMRASSSNSVRIEDAFVPEHLAVRYDFREHELGTDGTVGYQIHRNPLYLGRTLTFFNAELVATQVGAAWAAFDQVDALTRTRPASFPPRLPRIEAPEYHRWYGQLLGLVDSAETLLLAGVGRYEELGRRWEERQAEFTPEHDTRLRLVVQRAAMLAGEAVDLAFSTAGSSSARRGVPMQKYLRDVAMYRTHIAAQWDVTYNSTSRYLLGRPLTF